MSIGVCFRDTDCGTMATHFRIWLSGNLLTEWAQSRIGLEVLKLEIIWKWVIDLCEEDAPFTVQTHPTGAAVLRLLAGEGLYCTSLGTYGLARG